MLEELGQGEEPLVPLVFLTVQEGVDRHGELGVVPAAGGDEHAQLGEALVGREADQRLPQEPPRRLEQVELPERLRSPDVGLARVGTNGEERTDRSVEIGLRQIRRGEGQEEPA